MKEELSDCCHFKMIPPEDEEDIMGSMWRAYTCYICLKCEKPCNPLE